MPVIPFALNKKIEKVVLFDVDHSLVNEHFSAVLEGQKIPFDIDAIAIPELRRTEKERYAKSRKQLLQTFGLKNAIPLRNTLLSLLQRDDCAIVIATFSRYKQMVRDILAMILFGNTEDELSEVELKCFQEIMTTKIFYEPAPLVPFTEEEHRKGKNPHLFKADQKWNVGKENLFIYDDERDNCKTAVKTEAECTAQSIPFAGLPLRNVCEVSKQKNPSPPKALNQLRQSFDMLSYPGCQYKRGMKKEEIFNPNITFAIFAPGDSKSTAEYEHKGERDRPPLHFKYPNTRPAFSEAKLLDETAEVYKYITKAQCEKIQKILASTITDKPITKFRRFFNKDNTPRNPKNLKPYEIELELRHSVVVDTEGRAYLIPCSPDRHLGQGKYGKVVKAFDLQTGKAESLKIEEVHEHIREQLEEETAVLALEQQGLGYLTRIKRQPEKAPPILSVVPGYRVGRPLEDENESDTKAEIETKEFVSKTEIEKRYNIMVFKPGSPVLQLDFSLNEVPFSTRLSICIQVVDALDMMHDLGILHRDINPDNVLWTLGVEASLVDRNLSRILAPGQSVILSNQAVGHPEYQAPEVEEPVTFYKDQAYHAYSKASDIYSLGLVLKKILRTDNLPTKNLSLPEEEKNLALQKMADALIWRMTSHIVENRPQANGVLKTLQKIRAISEPELPVHSLDDSSGYDSSGSGPGKRLC